ncbi:MAG: fimbrillin family protein, partial [Rikenellaceae bacterium]|nr:fimbrillin family protein [Rikenellaceae bacterium]
MKTTKIHVLCLIAIALSGCSLRDDLVPEVGQGREIVLSAVDAAAQSPDTRGEAVTALRKIGVFGYSHTGDFEEVSSAALHADYFLNKPVTDLPGDGTWTYSGVRKYWPTDNHLLSFFAYAPHIDVEHTFDLTPESTAAAGTPTIDYTVPATITEQIDLMWANRTDMTAETADGVVPFTMNHALTQVGFVVNLDVNEYGAPFRVTFDKLVVRNVLGHGTLDLSRAPADPKLWATSRPASDAGWVSYTMIPTFRDGLALLTLDASKTTFAPGDINPWDEEGVSLLREG